MTWGRTQKEQADAQDLCIDEIPDAHYKSPTPRYDNPKFTLIYAATGRTSQAAAV